MKKIIILFITISITSCNCNKKTENISEEKEIVSENKEENEDILLGKISCKDLEHGSYNDWFIKSYNNHQLDTETLSEMKPLLKNINVQLFMGTWCEDSQREIPAFYKIMESLGIAEKNNTIIAVSRDKNTPDELEKGFDVQYVPTIIFSKEGKEVGRIVESPVESLEKDMLTILSGKEYKHTYQE